MTAFIGALLILLFMCIVAGAGSCTALLLIHLWRWARRTETYEPAAAQTPEESAWSDVQETFADDVPSELEVEVYDAIRRHRDGEDVTAGAPREAL